MLGYPHGLPFFSTDNIKIHFVGHSMGAITVRYLQHLLKIGYFDELHGQPKQDRSSLIASITTLAGSNNGSLVVNHFGMSYSREKN